jgi:hypothetical protein
MLSRMAANIREAKPAFSRRAWQVFHLIAALAIAMSAAASLSPPANDPEWKTPSEAYDPSLAGLDSVDKIVGAAHQRARRPGTTEAVYQLEQVMRYRFYHGYSRYGFHENWLAWLASRTVHPHLDAIVMPEEIARHGAAACSQQAIVVQAALTRMGVTYASVEVTDHFMTAAWINGEWHIVDPWGPNERNRSRLFKLEELMTVAGRKAMFPDVHASAKWDHLRFAVPRLVKIDEFPASRARLFHQVTGWLSDWLWLPLLSLLLARLVLRRRPSLWRRLPQDEVTAPAPAI